MPPMGLTQTVLLSALMNSVRKSSKRGAVIPESLLMLTSRRPSEVQASRLLGPFFRIETSRTGSAGDGLRPAGSWMAGATTPSQPPRMLTRILFRATVATRTLAASRFVPTCRTRGEVAFPSHRSLARKTARERGPASLAACRPYRSEGRPVLFMELPERAGVQNMLKWRKSRGVTTCEALDSAHGSALEPPPCRSRSGWPDLLARQSPTPMCRA